MKTIKKILNTLLVLLSLVGCIAIMGFVQPQTRIVREEIQVPVEVEAPTPNLRELIETVPPQYGISPLVAAAIVERESNGRRDAIRFEPSQVERARKAAPKGASADDVRQYASSHCAFQVMGYHMPALGMSWSDLYDPRTCADVAMKILGNCMERHKGKSKVGQIHGALACYNGSTQYADAVVNRIGELLIERTL